MEVKGLMKLCNRHERSKWSMVQSICWPQHLNLHWISSGGRKEDWHFSSSLNLGSLISIPVDWKGEEEQPTQRLSFWDIEGTEGPGWEATRIQLLPIRRGPDWEERPLQQAALPKEDRDTQEQLSWMDILEYEMHLFVPSSKRWNKNYQMTPISGH